MKLSKLILGIGVAAATLLPIKEAQADLKGNVRYIKTENERNSYGSYAEAQGAYSLPLEFKGFSFVDLYDHNGNKGEGYFGRTTLRREIKNSVLSKTQLLYSNE